ncbi:hypothetical protein GmRootV35_12540 [Variovorax sp. V35]
MNDEIGTTVTVKNMAEADWLDLVSRQDLAEDICQFEFRSEAGAELPAYTAGAHVSVKTGAGVTRAYSLCGDPANRSRYLIAVLKESAGRGGSIALHEQMVIGASVSVAQPDNFFPLSAAAGHHVLIAGGIGVTPLLAMARVLGRRLPANSQFCRLCGDPHKRKAWMFVGSELAGQRAAIVMSLVQSARLNGHDPWAYLRDVLQRLPTQRASQIEDLLPHRWQPASDARP